MTNTPTNIEAFFQQLLDLSGQLTEEEQRHVREHPERARAHAVRSASKPEPALTDAHEEQVKVVVRELLESLRRELLVLDWRKRDATRAAVKVGIERILDGGLPDIYDRALFARKSEAVFDHVFASYSDATAMSDGAPGDNIW